MSETFKVRDLLSWKGGNIKPVNCGEVIGAWVSEARRRLKEKQDGGIRADSSPAGA